MNQKSSLALKLELIWWIVTLILIAVVMFPIINNVNDYPFLFINIFFIIVFVTFTRYIFLLKYTFIAKNQILKAILAVLCIPLIFYLISEINYFQAFLDEEGLESFIPDMELKEQGSLMRYIRSEVLFFGIGGLIAAILFPIRMVISIWRYHNRGTV